MEYDRWSRMFALSLFVAAAVLVPRPAQAQQWAGEIGVGYVANAPSQLFGVGAHFILPALGGIGLYVDAKVSATTSISSDPGFIADTTASEAVALWNDRFLRDEQEWYTLNVALMRPVTPELTVYAGAGYSRRTVYAEFQDISGERGTVGFYWVEDPPQSGPVVNVLAGGLLRMAEHVYAQLGFETAPKGMSVGVRYVFQL